MTEEGHREREVLKARRDSLERLRAKGIEPFALDFPVTAHASELHDRYASLAADEASDDRFAVAGRVVMARRLGGLVFLVLRDRTGDIQLFCTEEHLGADGFGMLDEIDLGDIVGAAGIVVRTKRGELSIRAEEITLLTKALRPLPEKFHGLKDPDLRMRRRYLELATELDSRRMVRARAKLLKAIRGHLDAQGFVEVETPVLQSVAGGALAKPFTTHHNVLDIDLKLRISLELYLKRLLVGGLERVYEIGHNFRNEGIDRSHNPEFTMLEVYQAYADYHTMMELTEALVAKAASAVRGSLRFEYQGREIDLTPPWRRVTVLGSVSQKVGEEISLDRSDLADLAEGNGVGVDPGWGPGKIVVEMFEKLVEPSLWEPTFVCDYPREVSPLARPHRENPNLTEHVDPVVAGIELGTGYSELTDPDDQRARFEAQRQARARGEEGTHPLDEDFLMALEHGMPPAGGLGIGIDRLLMILEDAPSIRDTITFPHVRPEES